MDYEKEREKYRAIAEAHKEGTRIIRLIINTASEISDPQNNGLSWTNLIDRTQDLCSEVGTGLHRPNIVGAIWGMKRDDLLTEDSKGMLKRVETSQ